MTCKKTSKKDTKRNEKPEVKASEEAKNVTLEQFNCSVDNAFFYTSDKRLNAIDDDEIVQRIVEHYPEFNQQNKDTQLRKLFLAILDDKELVDGVLEYYSLSILDFFKIIYKQYSSLFNTLFIKKVKDKLQKNSYATK